MSEAAAKVKTVSFAKTMPITKSVSGKIIMTRKMRERGKIIVKMRPHVHHLLLYSCTLYRADPFKLVVGI